MVQAPRVLPKWTAWATELPILPTKFSKVAFDWVKLYVVSKSQTLTRCAISEVPYNESLSKMIADTLIPSN
jgi:hypothetical protein